MRKLNSKIAISAGVIVTLTMLCVGFLIISNPSEYSIIGWLLIGFSFPTGGFIATYFIIERKLIYSIFEGLIVSLIISIILVVTVPNNGVTYIDQIRVLGFFTFIITFCAFAGGAAGYKRFIYIPPLPF
ncbi:hypothetical protein [Methanobacterium sp. ACI-7]|uniref:hypothetical protein n=1 Tax=unclassified Methanobacterium TaxID=2627676 RepID=UPI0039C23670